MLTAFCAELSYSRSCIYDFARNMKKQKRVINEKESDNRLSGIGYEFCESYLIPNNK